MSTKLKLIFCLAIATLFVAACSSTTVVARDERATADAPAAGDPNDDSADADNAEEVANDADDNDAEEVANDADDEDDADADDPPDADEDEPDVDLSEIEGFGLGGEEQLAGLLSDCEDGSDLACDILFQLSGFDSPEEDAALTCGGRSDTTVVFCTEGMVNDGDSIAFSIDSEGLDAVVDLCVEDGDMTACDFLFYRSPVGSEFEAIGETCGDRVAVAVPDCRSFVSEDN